MVQCHLCGKEVNRLAKHVSNAHPEEFKRQEQLVLKYYAEGMSARKIAKQEDVMYTGGTSVVRVLKKFFTPEELEAGRKERIGATTAEAYAGGERDWVTEINVSRNQSEEGRKKNSEGLKKAYAEKRKKSWSKGLTAKTDERIAETARRASETLSEKAINGDLKTLLKPGSDHPNWKEDRSQVARYWRKDQDFQRKDRKSILKRAGYKCEKCGITAEELAVKQAEENLNRCTLECDHIIPIHKGGIRDWEENGQALCSFCHLAKTLSENTN